MPVKTDDHLRENSATSRETNCPSLIFDGKTHGQAFRDVFATTMQEMASVDRHIVYLDADLMNSVGMYSFWQENREQAFNCGICEANMMGVAAGLSATGFYPYVHTFSPFASRRCFDQVYLSVGYAKNSVCIWGSDPGIYATLNGGTHTTFEDIALMRSIPGSIVLDISDSVMFRWALMEAKNRSGVFYIRGTRKTTPAIYDRDTDFKLGRGITLRDGRDITVMASGLMVAEALIAATQLSEEGLDVRVVDLFSIKPIDAELIETCARQTGAIVTAENHSIVGGLGDAVSTVLEKIDPIPFARHAVQERFGQVGPLDFLQREYGLHADQLCKTIRSVMNRKK